MCSSGSTVEVQRHAKLNPCREIYLQRFAAVHGAASYPAFDVLCVSLTPRLSRFLFFGEDVSVQALGLGLETLGLAWPEVFFFAAALRTFDDWSASGSKRTDHALT